MVKGEPDVFSHVDLRVGMRESDDHLLNPVVGGYDQNDDEDTAVIDTVHKVDGRCLTLWKRDAGRLAIAELTVFTF